MLPVDKEESVTKEHDAEEPMPDKEKPIAMEKSDSDDELFFSADEEPESEPEDVDPTLWIREFLGSYSIILLLGGDL